MDVRLGRDELDLEAGRDVKRLALLVGRARGEGRDVLDRGRGLGLEQTRTNSRKNDEDQPEPGHAQEWASRLSREFLVSITNQSNDQLSVVGGRADSLKSLAPWVASLGCPGLTF